jgi:hypothetical protein
VLVLPTESANAGLVWRFKHGHGDRFATNSAIRHDRLSSGDGEKRLIVDRLDEAIPQGVEHRAQGSDVFGLRDMFLRLRNYGAVVDDGAASDAGGAVVDRDRRVDEISIGVEMADP